LTDRRLFAAMPWSVVCFLPMFHEGGYAPQACHP